MPYFDLIAFYENARFSFIKRGSNFLVYTVFTSMPSAFLTLYLLILVAALYWYSFLDTCGPPHVIGIQVKGILVKKGNYWKTKVKVTKILTLNINWGNTPYTSHTQPSTSKELDNILSDGELDSEDELDDDILKELTLVFKRAGKSGPAIDKRLADVWMKVCDQLDNQRMWKSCREIYQTIQRR